MGGEGNRPLGEHLATAAPHVAANAIFVTALTATATTRSAALTIKPHHLPRDRRRLLVAAKPHLPGS